VSDTEKRDAVLDRYSGGGWDYPDHEAMADRIVELEAAVKRVRALHREGFTSGCCRTCKGRDDIHVPLPCPTLRALEETP